MEIMDKNENVTNGQVSETTQEKLGDLHLRFSPTMKTTWADLSPPHSRSRNIMNDCLSNQVLNDNQVAQKMQNDNMRTSSTAASSEVVDNRITLETGPVIKLSVNQREKTHDQRAMTLPKRSCRRTRNYATWKDLTSSKDKHVFDNKMSCSCGSTPRDGTAKDLVTWKDFSPPVSPTNKGKLLIKAAVKGKKSDSAVVKRSPERRGRQKRRPESGYYSNDVQGESREGFDSSLSGSDIGNTKSGAASSPEDACNEYFYDEDFIVQFDTNIRDGSVPPELSDQEPNTLTFPQSLTGSYTRFGLLQDSFNQHNMFLGQYESELSGSRTSMEISSSEREMMCSSDMLDFSNDPLFTPTPTSEGVAQHFSMDSLGHGAGLENSRNSADLVVDCCPKKEEYFLSFDTSQARSSASVSEHSYSSQTSSSQDEPRTEIGLSASASTGDDNEEVCSSSFHFCHAQYASQNGVSHSCRQLGHRSHPAHRGRASSMGALPERSIEKSSLSDLEKGQRCSSRNTRSLDRNSSSSQSHSCHKQSSLVSATDMHYSDEVNGSPKRQRNITSWKRVKNLQKFGVLENMLNNELYSSLPTMDDHTGHNVRTRRKFNEDLQSMADSFHNKRHSASLLEMYQRMKSTSNPVSPNTVNMVECILFPQNRLSDDEKLCVSRSGLDTCCESEICCCGKRGMKLDLGNKQEANDHRVVENPGIRTLSASSKAWSTKSTSVSPDTLVLWHGTRNFAAQFPPKTKDCGIQTSETEDDNTAMYLDHSMQTSPTSASNDFLSVFNDVCGHQSRTTYKTEPANRKRECVSEYREKNSTASPSVKRSKSLSPSRMGRNSFYTYQSLPDLSFLSSTRYDEEFSPQLSLFDPVKIPIILTPVVDDSKQTQWREGSGACTCQKEKKVRNLKPSELASSSSGFSTSSSSGIDPGYCETRRCCTSLAADLERLLFLPPHLESNPKFSQNKCSMPSSKSEGFKQNSGNRHQRAANFGVRNELELCRCENCRSDSESARRENEMCRNTVLRRESEPSKREMQLVRRLSNSTSSSLSSFYLEGLYVLQEASPTSETADSGPAQRDPRRSETYCDGLRTGCTEADVRDMNDQATDMIGQIYEQLSRDRKPLKSCLRKKRDFKARSLSIPDSFDANGEQKPPKKPSRYSIACDGVFPQLVSDEHFENANIQLPPPDQREEKIFAIKEDVMVASSTSSSFEEGNFTKKSVSFASEVSFHSPQYSPKHPGKPQRLITQTVSSLDLHEDMLTLEIIEQEENSTKMKALIQISPETSADFNSNLGDQELTTETARKRSILLCVTQAAEALVEHFAQARDPFDKLRLGCSAESPKVASLFVTHLCPALEMVIEEGMKPYLTGFHVFGKIHITPWRVAEMSSELGPYTRAVNELVRKLKLKSSLVTNKQKFYAFVVGLANLRLLDFWMGYIRSKKDIVSRVYESDSILCLAETTLRRHYDNMLLALQPLAVLPFQLEFDIVCPSTALDNSVETNSIDLNNPDTEQAVASGNSYSGVLDKGQGEMSERSKQAENGQDLMSKKGQGQVSKKGQDQSPEKDEGQEKSSSQSWNWFGGATFPRTKRLLSSFNMAKAEDKVNNSVKNVESSKSKLSSSDRVFSPKLTKDLENIEVKEKLSKASEKPVDGGKSPVSSFTNLAQRFLQRTQSQDSSSHNLPSENNATASLMTKFGRRQSVDSLTSAEPRPTHVQSQSFSLISFFDKLLLPDRQTKSQRSSWTVDAQVADDSLFRDEANCVSLPAALDGSCSSSENVESVEDKDLTCEKPKGADGLQIGRNETAGPKCVSAEIAASQDIDEDDENKENIYPDYFLEPRLECERAMLEFETSDSQSEGSSIQLEVDMNLKLGDSEGKLTISETKETFLDESSPDDEAGGGEGLATSPPISEGLTNSSPISDGLTNSSPTSEALTGSQPVSDGLTGSQTTAEGLTRAEEPVRNLAADSFSGVDINANSPSFQHNTYAIVVQNPAGTNRQTEPRMEFRTFHPHLSSFKPSPAISPSQSEEPSTEESQAGIDSGKSDQSAEDRDQVVEAKSIRKDSFGLTSFKHAVTLVAHESDDPDELSFDQGDYLEVLAQLDDDWLFCASGRREGRVRVTEVRQLSDEETFEKLHDNFYY